MDCPKCETEFDWDDGTCPSCGWSKDERDANLQAPWEEGDSKTSRTRGLIARLKRYL
jgi:hypothetical protein